MVSIELEADLEERVRHFALENHVSESFLIREAILRWLKIGKTTPRDSRRFPR